jgi:ceramide glucosyltransferase
MAKLVVVLLAIGVASLALTLATHVTVLLVRRRQRPGTVSIPITVFKPLKGADPELYANLVSFARQDYPAFELVFGCEDPFDPAIAVARRLMREFPAVAMKLVCGGRQIGLNPKVNNLARMARSARYAHWLISDSDVRVGSGYLRAMAAELGDADVGLVSSVIAGTCDQGFPSRVESLHLNTFIARSVCGADVLAGHACVIGKSMLFHRADLEKVGGFEIVKDVLAEDYVLGQLFRSAGRSVALSPYVIRTVTSARSVRDVWNRRVRWGQMRRHLSPILYWGEPLMMPAVWLTLSLLAFGLNPLGAGGWARPVAGFGAAGLVVLAVSDALLVQKLAGGAFGARNAIFGPIRDFVSLFAWVVAAFKRKVIWRGSVFAIGSGSLLVPLSREESYEESALEDGSDAEQVTSS